MPSRHQARTAADLLTTTGNASARVIAARMLAFSDPAGALSPWHQAEAQRMTSEKVGAASEGLLAAGAEIHEFQPTMFHCKMLIVDQLMVSVYAHE